MRCFVLIFSMIILSAGDGVYRQAPAPGARPVPILMFHHLTDDPYADPDFAVTTAQLREFLVAMGEAGFEAVCLSAVEDYVLGGGDLPPNPFVVSFDDGYLSNYTCAFPILLELEIPAIFNIIGSRRGADTYLGRPATPHFTWEQAAYMAASGLVIFGNHSFAMHGAPGYTIGRVGVVPLENETEERFMAAVSNDIAAFHASFRARLGHRTRFFAYPFGWHSPAADRIISMHGYTVTMLTGDAVSFVTRYDPGSLFGLQRINVSGNLTACELVELVQALSSSPYLP